MQQHNHTVAHLIKKRSRVVHLHNTTQCTHAHFIRTLLSGYRLSTIYWDHYDSLKAFT